MPSWILDNYDLSLSGRRPLVHGQDSGQKSSQVNNNVVVTSSKMRYRASFSEPLRRRWPWPSEWEKDGWEPPAEQCNSHAWWLFYLSCAV
ncbi:unnamed protein product [Calypogeia fissa]